MEPADERAPKGGGYTRPIPMVRVLHLVRAPDGSGACAGFGRDDATDSAVLGCVAAAERATNFEHTIVLFASSAGESRADRLGLRGADRITPPLGEPRLAMRGLKQLLSARSMPDVVQCWNESLVGLARRVAPRGALVLGPPLDLPFPRAASGTREAIRSLIDAPSGTPIVGIVCESPGDADAHRLQYATGLLEICGLHSVGFIPAGARSISRGKRFHRETLVRVRTCISASPAWSLLPACDAVFLHPPRAWELDRSASEVDAEGRASRERGLVLLGHSAGVPVIVPRGSGALGRGLERAEGSISALATELCMAPSFRPADMARALLVLFEQGLPRVRALGAELRDRCEGSGERERRLRELDRSWDSALLAGVRG